MVVTYRPHVRNIFLSFVHFDARKLQSNSLLYSVWLREHNNNSNNNKTTTVKGRLVNNMSHNAIILSVIESSKLKTLHATVTTHCYSVQVPYVVGPTTSQRRAPPDEGSGQRRPAECPQCRSDISTSPEKPGSWNQVSDTDNEESC